jgi:hypothetical protein
VKISKNASETSDPLALPYGEYALKDVFLIGMGRRFKDGREYVLAVQDHLCVSSITWGQFTTKRK